MSAWRVSKSDVDAIVQYALAENVLPLSEANEFGLRLDVENQLSLRARYNDDLQDTEYRFEGIESPLDDVKMLKHLQFYEYQTCEHDSWERDDNPVRLKIAELREIVCRKVGLEGIRALYDDPSTDGMLKHRYEEAPWGTQSLRQLIADKVDR